MLVGICYTKTTVHGIAIADAFCDGVLNSGDNIIKFKLNKKLNELKECDISFQVCSFRFTAKQTQVAFRNKIYELQKEYNKPLLIADSGFILNNQYKSIGLAGIKNNATYFNQNSKSDRFDALNLKIQPWRKTGEHILLLGQRRFGSSIVGIDLFNWYENIINLIKHYTDRKIIFRQHPGIKNKPKENKLERELLKKLNIPILNNPSLQEQLINCWVTVALTTDASVMAILQGIPLFTTNETNITSPVANTDFSKIEKPKLFERDQFFYNLAYCQWTLDEIKQGLPWRHFKKHLFQC